MSAGAPFLRAACSNSDVDALNRHISWHTSQGYQVHYSFCREVFFEANGVPRTVEIVDRTDQSEGGGPVRKAAREKSDPDVLGSVGAPMAGEVIEVSAKPGRSAPPTCVPYSAKDRA